MQQETTTNFHHQLLYLRIPCLFEDNEEAIADVICFDFVWDGKNGESAYLLELRQSLLSDSILFEVG